MPRSASRLGSTDVPIPGTIDLPPSFLREKIRRTQAGLWSAASCSHAVRSIVVVRPMRGSASSTQSWPRAWERSEGEPEWLL